MEVSSLQPSLLVNERSKNLHRANLRCVLSRINYLLKNRNSNTKERLLLHKGTIFVKLGLTESEMEQLWSITQNGLGLRKWSIPRNINLDYMLSLFSSSISFSIFDKRIIQHFRALKNLTLNFQRTKITDQYVEMVSHQIGKNLHNLQSLAINLSWCPGVTDQSLSIFASEISRNLTQLRKLDIILIGCTKITDKSVKNLGSNIGRYLVNLQHLSLYITSCKNITDAGLTSLGYFVGKYLVRLFTLILDFSGSIDITGEGFCEFGAKVCKNLSLLRHLSLTFNWCKKIKEKDIEVVKAKIYEIIPCVDIKLTLTVAKF